jgi:hypothetical protein
LSEHSRNQGERAYSAVSILASVESELNAPWHTDFDHNVSILITAAEVAGR